MVFRRRLAQSGEMIKNGMELVARRGSREQPDRRCRERLLYLLMECLVGVTVDVGAAFETAKVNQTFQPSGRFSEANSL